MLARYKQMLTFQKSQKYSYLISFYIINSKQHDGDSNRFENELTVEEQNAFEIWQYFFFLLSHSPTLRRNQNLALLFVFSTESVSRPWADLQVA
jgi:hypothetical protein